MSRPRLAARTWLRYVLPLSLIGGIACGVMLWVVLELSPALDVAHARTRLWIGVALALAAFATQLALVAAVAPAMRALVRGERRSQREVLATGLVQLARAILPVTAALAAVAVGAAALVVPGVLVLVLLAPVGASERLGEPLPAPLVDAIALARAALVPVACVAVGALVIDLAIANGGQLALFGAAAAAKKPPPAVTSAMQIAWWQPVALAALSAPVACALAAASIGKRS